MTRILTPRRLTREAFSPFGDIIETADAELRLINNGTTQRFHDLARIEALGDEARVLVSIFRGEQFAFPIPIAMMERHPLGSQAFMPLQGLPWLVVVAHDRDGRPGDPLAFLVEPDESGMRGVNYAPGTWHHPLLSLDARSDFLVVDRGGAGVNLEEFFYGDPFVIEGRG